MTSELVTELLVDWVRAEASVIGEFSGDMTTSYRSLILKAMERARLLGLPWSDDLVPDYVMECAAQWGDEPHWRVTQ